MQTSVLQNGEGYFKLAGFNFVKPRPWKQKDVRVPKRAKERLEIRIATCGLFITLFFDKNT